MPHEGEKVSDAAIQTGNPKLKEGLVLGKIKEGFRATGDAYIQAQLERGLDWWLQSSQVEEIKGHLEGRAGYMPEQSIEAEMANNPQCAISMRNLMARTHGYPYSYAAKLEGTTAVVDGWMGLLTAEAKEKMGLKDGTKLKLLKSLGELGFKPKDGQGERWRWPIKTGRKADKFITYDSLTVYEADMPETGGQVKVQVGLRNLEKYNDFQPPFVVDAQLVLTVESMANLFGMKLPE